MSLENVANILLALGTLLVLYNQWLIFRAILAKKWNKTDGVITQSELIEFSASIENDASFKPKIEYSYFVNGVAYKSKRIYFGDHIMTSFNKKYTKNTIEKYPVGSVITVYYNKLNEKQSVLDVGIKYQLIIGSLLGLIFLIIGLILIYEPYFKLHNI